MKVTTQHYGQFLINGVKNYMTFPHLLVQIK